MNDRILEFSHVSLDKLRVFNCNGEPWYNKEDISNILKITNIDDILSNNDSGILDVSISSFVLYKKGTSIEANTSMVFLNEESTYSLIFSSIKPRYKKLQSWIFDEILPYIREISKLELLMEEVLQEPDKYANVLD